MAIDIVKSLKIENPASGGVQTDMSPTETSVLADYLGAKGISFEGTQTFYFDKVGRTFGFNHPQTYETYNYLANGEVNFIEFYNSSSFVTTNRIARVDFTYDVNIDPATEVFKIYDTNGTTILRTVTWTYTFTSGDLTQSNFVVT